MMNLITYNLLMLLLWMLLTVLNESQARVVLNQEMEMARENELLECQSGAVDEYCEAGRCECSAANSECISGTCQCKPGYEANNGACQPVIPDGYNQIGDTSSYLKYVDQDTLREDAQTACRDDDPFGRTDLITIDSQQKNEAVKNLATNAVWFGLKQKAGEQWKYGWSRGGELTTVAGQLTNDGTNGMFQNWLNAEQIDEDAHDSEDCVLMAPDGTWRDTICEITLHYACEFIG